MKRTILILIFSFLSFQITNAQAPDIEWHDNYGGNGTDIVTSLDQVKDGGYIVGVRSESGISGNKTEPSRGGNDYWVLKLNNAGNIEWQKTFGGNIDDQIRSVSQTLDNGYIVGGFSSSGISGDKTQESYGNYDYWILKLNSAGNIEWQKTFGGDNSDKLSSVMQTVDGGYIIGGSSFSGISGDKTQESYGNYDYWILKLNSAGNIEWQNTIGGNDEDTFKSISQTTDGGYILGGYSVSGISGNKTVPSKGDFDYWVVKLNNTGYIEWQKTFGGSISDGLSLIRQTIDGGYIIGGSSYSGISGNKTEPSRGGNDYWVLKLNNAGNIEWQKTIGGLSNDYLGSIQQTVDGGYIIGGFSSSGIGGDKTDICEGGDDYWVVRLDKWGNLHWQKTIGGTETDVLLSICQTMDGGYIMGGYSNSGGYWGTFDGWIIKLQPDAPLETELIEISDEFKLQPAFPNPFNPTTTILYSLNKDSNVSINIYDISGKLTTTLTNEYQTKGWHSITWDGRDNTGNKVGAGVYFYQVKAGDFVETRKMVLLK